jgi:formylglycine-generating enzyme required for sulfatase activity
MGMLLICLAVGGLSQPGAYAVDTTPPTGTIIINSNRSATNSANVTLALTWSDGDSGSGVSRMRFSNDGATWSVWEVLAVTRVYTLPAGADGHRTVRVQFLDKANNRSAMFSDYIRLDTTPPTGTIVINGAASVATSQAVTLGLTWSDGTGAGVSRMRLSDNGSTWTAWEPPTATRAHTLPLPNGYHTVRVQYLDGANNYSAVFNDFINLQVSPQAAFQVTPSSGTPPLTTEFEDLSVAGDGPIDSWTWDFGDGSPTSSEQHPVHTYSDLGIYTVTLTVKSGTLQHQLVKGSCVNVATTVASAFDQFVDPAVPVEEASDDLFAAMDAAFQTGGADGALQELDTAFYAYLNGGGDPLVLVQRSEEASPTVLSLDMVQQRRLLNYSDKNDYDINLPAGQVCSNVVIHINGMATSGLQGQSNYTALRDKLDTVLAEKDGAAEFVYNPSVWLIGIVWDFLVECGSQKILDEVAAQGVAIGSIHPLVQALKARIQDHVAKGRNVIIVPHSQGNFYTEQALLLLTSAQREKVRVVETGSPVSAPLAVAAANDFRVDIEGDLVGQLLSSRYTNPPLPYEGDWVPTQASWWHLWANFKDDAQTLLEHHDFRGAYMQGQAAQTIRAKVDEFCVLPAPVVTAFSVNNGTASTSSRTVTLNSTCTRAPQEYMASESASTPGAGADWKPYFRALSFRITSAGNGVKSIYFWVRNVDGLVSVAIAPKQITLNEVAGGPAITSVTPNPVPVSASSQTLTVNGSGFVSGCTVRLRDYTENLGPWTKATAFVNAGKVTLSANFGAAATSWTAQVINPNGTPSAEYTFTVSSAQQGLPAVNAFAVNSGSGTTVSRGVTLNSVCAGAPAEYQASESSSFSGASWFPYSTAPSFTIASAGYGTKTVWFKVRNAAGMSSPISDTITLEENTGTTETVMLPGSVPLKMVWIPGGTFQMGRYAGEQDSYSDEDPQHLVTLGGFWMAKYELTKRQWTAVMGTAPWTGQSYVLADLDSPAVYVSWNNAQSFLTALNSYTGKSFRLPSEAQWEYACRGGTQTRFYWGDDPGYTAIGDYAWYVGNAWNAGQQYAHVVGGKAPNAFGLYDMSGNVWEWCEDDWHGSYTGAPEGGQAWVDSPRGSHRVLRGGGWYNSGYYCRSAYRYYSTPGGTFSNYGFRIAWTP